MLQNMKELINAAEKFQFTRSNEVIVCSYIKEQVPLRIIEFYYAYPRLFEKMEVLLYPHIDKLNIFFNQNPYQNAYNFVDFIRSYELIVDNIGVNSLRFQMDDFVKETDKASCYQTRDKILLAYNSCSTALQKKISCEGEAIDQEKDFPCKTTDHCLDSFLCLPLSDIARLVGEICNEEYNS